MYSPLTYDDCVRMLEGRRLPAAFVDLDAFDSNLDTILKQIENSGKSLRIASKSIRCVGLAKRLLERGEGRLRGIMCFTVEEAAFLHGRGLDDLLVAYPTLQPTDLSLLAEITKKGADVQLVVDNAAQIRAMGEAGRKAGVELQAIIEADMSYRPGGSVHIGVRRSAIRTGPEAYALVEEARGAGGVKVVGVMGYEAQIAGLADRNPFSPSMNPVRRMIRRLSTPDVAKRRQSVVGYLRDKGVELRIVNGGGTGSVDSTSLDDSVTEVTAGSGFFCPHLFSYYSNIELKPAAFFALQVVRVPAAGMVTCFGGGYIASGESGPDRLPVPYLPEGCELLKLEGAGEVQTPVVIKKGNPPGLGGIVVFRHAKGGELSERFNEYLLVEGKKVVGSEKTYRGDGMCFV